MAHDTNCDVAPRVGAARYTMASSLQCAIRCTFEYNANDNWRDSG